MLFNLLKIFAVIIFILTSMVSFGFCKDGDDEDLLQNYLDGLEEEILERNINNAIEKVDKQQQIDFKDFVANHIVIIILMLLYLILIISPCIALIWWVVRSKSSCWSEPSSDFV